MLNDTWPEEHSGSWIIKILIACLKFTTSNIRPHVKEVVSRVIADGYFNTPHGVRVGTFLYSWCSHYITPTSSLLPVGTVLVL